MEMREGFYEFFVRGHHEPGQPIDQIKGAFVQYWPMAVDESGLISMLGNSSGNPRPLTADDVLPPAIASKINAAALVTVNALNDANAALRKELAAAEAKLLAMTEDMKGKNRLLREKLAVAEEKLARLVDKSDEALVLS